SHHSGLFALVGTILSTYLHYPFLLIIQLRMRHETKEKKKKKPQMWYFHLWLDHSKMNLYKKTDIIAPNIIHYRTVFIDVEALDLDPMISCHIKHTTHHMCNHITHVTKYILLKMDTFLHHIWT
ncbi:hypothetical protein ACJX0J_039217, partial [Zea mays]